MLTITGYSDRISVRPGETIKFMVNCEHPTYQADIVRLICADDTPSGPGFKEKLVRTPVSKRRKGRRQVIHAGSYAMVESRPLLETLGSFTVQAMIWPTTPGKGEQGIVTKWDPRSRTGFALVIDDAGSVALRLGMADGTVETVSIGKPLLERHWYLAAASYDAESGRVTVHQEPLLPYARANDGGTAKRTLGPAAANTNAPIVMAGIFKRRQKGRVLVDGLYNGKIDAPRLVGRALDRLEIERMRNEAVPASIAPDILCAWDFSRDITSIKISDRSPHHFDGEIVNLPARGMTGWNFSGEEMCWRHARHEYGAIHFHDDDLYDAGWDVDFEWTVPARVASGVYAARLRAKGAEEYVPFVVLPSPGKAARIAFLLPTVEYMAYANEHLAFDGPLGELLTGQIPTLNANQLFLNEHREYGASLYDTHSDGSGVCYSSRLRPILNMRPKVETPWACAGEDATNAREFILDMYVVDWLTHFGFDHDVITDEDVHREGIDLLKPYHVLITGGHPEYYSKAMRDAVHGFTQQGGRLMYLGGNGFYWRVAMHRGGAGGDRGAPLRGRDPHLGGRPWRVLSQLHRRVRRDLAPSGRHRAAAVGRRRFRRRRVRQVLLLPAHAGQLRPPRALHLRGDRRGRADRRFRLSRRGRGRQRAGCHRSAPGHAPARAGPRAFGEPHRPLSGGERGGACESLRARWHRAREGQGRHGLLRNAERRRGLLGRLDLLPGEPAVERV